MSLKKRAVEGIVVAGSLVMMSSIAQAADVFGVQPMTVAAVTRTDLATNGTAGVVAELNQYETTALESLGQTVDIEQMNRALVATAEATDEALSEVIGQLADEEVSEVTEQPEDEAVTEQPEEGTQTELADDDSTQQLGGVQAGVTTQLMGSLQAGLTETQAGAAESADETQTDELADAADETQADGTQTDATTESAAVTASTDGEMSEEEQEWQNLLMADVQDFLYVRAEGNENAEIVGKLYKGAVAQITEIGDTWTHVESGNVDGYVMNSYCLFGSDAYNYAVETFDVEAEVQTDGLRVRSSADTEASVLAAVSTGMSFTVDTSAEEVEGWVAIDYKGSTGYVSAEYVTTGLALGEAITIQEEKEQLAKEAAEAAKSAQVSSSGTVQNSAVAASVDDVTLLAALIQCEAGNECYEGQLAVGAVVMNRLRSGSYPNSIYGVIYQSGQFTPAGRGSVASVAANGPKASCIQAAQEAINGADNTGGALHFRGASSGQAGVVIGNHVFW